MLLSVFFEDLTSYVAPLGVLWTLFSLSLMMNPPSLPLTSTATAEPVVFLSLYQKTSGGRGPGKKDKLDSFEVILVTKKITRRIIYSITFILAHFFKKINLIPSFDLHRVLRLDPCVGLLYIYIYQFVREL
jgi:hypothetical protein